MTAGGVTKCLRYGCRGRVDFDGGRRGCGCSRVCAYSHQRSRWPWGAGDQLTPFFKKLAYKTSVVLMEPAKERDYYKTGYDLGISAGKDVGKYDVLDYITTYDKKKQDHFSAMLLGLVDASISVGSAPALSSVIAEEYGGDEGVLGIFEKRFPDARPDQKATVRATLSRLASSSSSTGTPTITLGPRYRGGALSPKSKSMLAKIKKEGAAGTKSLKDEDVGITDLPVEEGSKEDIVSDYELNAAPETAELFASQDFDDQKELQAQRAKEASLRARQFDGRYVNTPKGKAGATILHSAAVKNDATSERNRKILQLASQEASARVASTTNNLRASIEARQSQQLQESRHAQAQVIASKARSAEHDRREAERRRERRELISNAYEVMYGEALGDAINELGVEEEMRMAKQFYKIMGGKGSPGFLRKAYSPRAARVTAVAMEKKAAPAKRTTRKKKSVKFVLEEVDVPQKKISKRRYMKKTSGKGGKKGKGKGSKKGGKKGKGKGGKKGGKGSKK